MQKSKPFEDQDKPNSPPIAPLTMSVPEAGMKYYGLARQASYSAAQRGDIVAIKVGGRLRAITAAMDAKFDRIKELALDDNPDA